MDNQPPEENRPRNQPRNRGEREIDLDTPEGLKAAKKALGLGAITRVTVTKDDLERIYAGLSRYRNIEFTLSRDEMARILLDTTEARQVIEGWLTQIEEKEKYYTEEGENRVVKHKLDTALSWLDTIEYHTEINKQREDKKTKQEIIDEAHARTGVHDLRKAIASSDFKALEAYSTQVGMRALLLGFKTKQATIAFNTYQRFFDRYLYNYATTVADEKKGIEEQGGVYQVRVTPELITGHIRPAVKEEFRKNWELYGFSSEAEAIDAERIGYSVFTASQRKAVHVSKGHINNQFKFNTDGGYYRKPLENPDFLSDPDEILSNLYSPLEMQLIKWTRPSVQQQKVLDSIMKFMGNGNLHVGEQLFTDSLYIADLFTSGWRIKKALEAIEIRMKAATNFDSLTPEEKAKVSYRLDSLGLGMRLKFEKDKSMWLKAIARYRPLEILKDFVVDIDRHGNAKDKTARQKQIKEMFKRGEFRVGNRVFHHYVELEEALGRYAYPIYEKGLKSRDGTKRDWTTMRGVDVGTAGPQNTRENPFARADSDLIRDVVDRVNRNTFGDRRDPNRLEANEFIELYRKVQGVVQHQSTIEDMVNEMNGKHSYFFSRTMFVDDVPFDLLETEQELSDGTMDIPLSQKYNDIESGGRDAYRRIWNDTTAGFNASAAFMKGIFSTNVEGLYESLVEGANNMNQYAGKEPAMKLVYGVSGGWLKLAKADSLYGALGLQNKLPVATSDLEKWFGQGAPSLSREELFQASEKLKLIFGDITGEFPDVKEIEKRMSKEIGTGKLAMWLTRSKTLLFVIIIALVQQALKDLEEDTKE